MIHLQSNFGKEAKAFIYNFAILIVLYLSPRRPQCSARPIVHIHFILICAIDFSNRLSITSFLVHSLLVQCNAQFRFLIIYLGFYLVIYSNTNLIFQIMSEQIVQSYKVYTCWTSFMSN